MSKNSSGSTHVSSRPPSRGKNTGENKPGPGGGGENLRSSLRGPVAAVMQPVSPKHELDTSTKYEPRPKSKRTS